MKKIFVVLCTTLIISVMLNVLLVNNKQRISNHISNFIVANIQQLSNSYEIMYSADESNRYFEQSLIYASDICDKIEEEIVFYNVIYPKRDMLLAYLVDDYKLLVRVIKNNPSLIKEAQLLHDQLHQYILNYIGDSIDYSNNPAKMLYKTDKKIKINDNGNWYLIHDAIVKLSKR